MRTFLFIVIALCSGRTLTAACRRRLQQVGAGRRMAEGTQTHYAVLGFCLCGFVFVVLWFCGSCYNRVKGCLQLMECIRNNEVPPIRQSTTDRQTTVLMSCLQSR